VNATSTKAGIAAAVVTFLVLAVFMNIQEHGWVAWARLAASGEMIPVRIISRNPEKHDGCNFEYSVNDRRYTAHQPDVNWTSARPPRPCISPRNRFRGAAPAGVGVAVQDFRPAHHRGDCRLRHGMAHTARGAAPMTFPASHEGGCLCKAVRFRVTGDPLHSVICHCHSCRRASGAPSVAWLTFDRGRSNSLPARRAASLRRPESSAGSARTAAAR